MTRQTRFHGVRTGSPAAGFAPAVTSAVVIFLVAALLLVAPARQEEVPAAAGDDLSLAARSTCTDVLVVGIDGNGQGQGAKPGAVVASITNKLTAMASNQGRTLTAARVRFKTRGAVDVLRTKRGPALKAVSRPGLRRWKKPIGSGVRSTRALVNRRLDSCPEQQVMLVGYAQGAAVAHRVVQDLAENGRLANVAGAVTISDPSRVKKSVAGKALGNPGASRRSEGLLTRFTRSVGDVPPSEGTFGVVSVCHKGDLVCNPNRTKAAKALRLALSYSAKSSRPAMKQAVERAWSQISLWPVPASQQLVAANGQPFAEQLAVRGGSPAGQPATWTGTLLPAGVSLSSSGVLSGTLSAPGVYEVRYTVFGTAPVTTPKSAVLLISVRAESGAASAGGMTSCEVRSDTTAWCWGRNDFGQIGDGTNILRIHPTAVQGTDWARISTSGSFTCGVKRDETLWCWGLNNFGQLGGADKATSPVPRQVGTDIGWKDVSASWSHACATRTDGSLWCWGQNLRGQLGAGNVSGRSTAPVRVLGDQQWSHVSAGGWHTCAATTSGEGYCWGDNAFGQLGDATTTLRVRPALVTGGLQFTQFATTWGRTCAITAAGAAQCWGENANGELGNDTRTNSATPVAVAGGHTFAQVATGVAATCGARPDGQVLCWGSNRYGSLGPAAGGDSATPVAAGIASTGGVVAAGWLHFCGSGSGCWGPNDAGQLGNGTITPVAMPAKTAPWGPGTTTTDKQARKWSPRKLARLAVTGRPAVNGRATRRTPLSMETMTLNLLGSQHTAPTGARPAFAPGRVRVEWAKDLIDRRGASLVGLSEPQPDQIDQLNVALSGGYSIYPGNTMDYDSAPQSVMWKDSEWDFVWGNTVQMPFMRQARPQPVVRLRNRGTGREIYWINAHLSPGKMQSDRDKGLAIIGALIERLKPDGLPILVTGDLNEHALAFRKIACKYGLDAAVGGVATKKRCRPPKAMRVDWIFGLRGTFDNTLVDISPQVRRTTDHAVVSSRFSVQ